MNTLYSKRPRVLIVDDQKNWREALCDMLDPEHEIETAASYDEARRQLWQHAFHVLVADQRLVDADDTNIEGILLLDEIAKLRDGAQAIIVTAYPTVEAAKEALRGRNAYDYLLKRPEEGGPFNIRAYRARIKEAAEKAMQMRQKAITLDFSISSLATGLTYNLLIQTLFQKHRIAPDMQGNIRKMIHKLLCPFQPLAYGMSRVWLSEPDRICEILCWSREYSKATLVRIGSERRSLNAREAGWLRESWRLVENEESVSASLIGISYTIEDMIFEDFVVLVEGRKLVW